MLASILACGKSETPSEAAQRVYDEDGRILRQLADDAKARPGEALTLIETSIADRRAVSLQSCPQELADAYNSHIVAWETAANSIRSGTDPAETAASFLNAQFGDTSARDTLAQTRPELNDAGTEVFVTSLRFLQAAQRHGANVTELNAAGGIN